jgi:hypothetical protein
MAVGHKTSTREGGLERRVVRRSSRYYLFPAHAMPASWLGTVSGLSLLILRRPSHLVLPLPISTIRCRDAVEHLKSHPVPRLIQNMPGHACGRPMDGRGEAPPSSLSSVWLCPLPAVHAGTSRAYSTTPRSPPLDSRSRSASVRHETLALLPKRKFNETWAHVPRMRQKCRPLWVF